MDHTRSTLLIQLADTSNQEAWSTFDRIYGPLISGYARARGVRGADVDDIVQECTRRVLRYVGDYQHTGRFRDWLRKITNNLINDAWRRQRSQPAESRFWRQHPDPAADLDAEWDRQWFREHLRYVLEKVKGEVKDTTYDACYRVVFAGESPGDVATALGISTNQVYLAKFRVLDRIKAEFSSLTGEEFPE